MSDSIDVRDSQNLKAMARTRVFGVPVLDWAWLLAVTIWRVAISARLGLGVDEAHYAMYGVHLDWSYFDHPPLVGWAQSLTQAIFGLSELSVRTPAILCGVVSSILAFRLAEKLTGQESSARVAALSLNASFIAAALWMMFLPDTPLLPLALWLVLIVGRLMERERFRDWIELGVCLGLCGLAKYTAVFLPIALLAFVAIRGEWRRVKLGGLVCAMAIALALISPVLAWNYQREWISFKYQTGRVLGGGGLNPKTFGVFLAGQIGGYSPFLIVAAAIGWWNRRKSIAPAALFAALSAAPTFLFFGYSSFREEVLLHWTLVGWGLLIPLGMAFAWRSGWRRLTFWTLGVSLAITGILMAELLVRAIPFPEYQSPYADLTGWMDVRKDIEHARDEALARGETRGREFSIAVPNWTLGSRALYYLSAVAPVYVLDDRFDQYDLWEAGPPKTPDLLIVSWRGFELGDTQRAQCEKIEPITRRTFVSHGRPVNQVSLAWCSGFKPRP